MCTSAASSLLHPISPTGPSQVPAFFPPVLSSASPLRGLNRHRGVAGAHSSGKVPALELGSAGERHANANANAPGLSSARGSLSSARGSARESARESASALLVTVSASAVVPSVALPSVAPSSIVAHMPDNEQRGAAADVSRTGDFASRDPLLVVTESAMESAADSSEGSSDEDGCDVCCNFGMSLVRNERMCRESYDSVSESDLDDDEMDDNDDDEPEEPYALI